MQIWIVTNSVKDLSNILIPVSKYMLIPIQLFLTYQAKNMYATAGSIQT